VSEREIRLFRRYQSAGARIPFDFPALLDKASAIGETGLIAASTTFHHIAQASRDLISIDRYVKELGNSLNS
jgi:hypothetical protein